MKQNNRRIQGITITAFMLALIFDAQTAKEGASEGVALCIQSVIPSLFLFIFLSLLLTSRLYGQKIPILSHFHRLGIVPKGAESILLMAFLGGYPVGAQTVYSIWTEGSLDRKSAKRLLGFCNNAGPSFIFGMLSHMFTNITAVWVLWLIHILSALTTGMILPGQYSETGISGMQQPLSASSALKKATWAMAGICGWIIVTRTLLAFALKYFLSAFPQWIQVIICGFTELTNGCILLPGIPTEPIRFIIASILLSAGGMCVYLQTRAVTADLGTGMYLPGKILQSAISLVLSSALAPLLYSIEEPFDFFLLSGGGMILLSVITLAIKKSCSNLEKAVV